MTSQQLNLIINTHCNRLQYPKSPFPFTKAIFNEVTSFHQSLPNYAVTPLNNFKNLADELGIAKLWIKDESYRFGLNAFKVLGASYAIAKQFTSQHLTSLTYDELLKTCAENKKPVFITATDGNHGRAVAFMAQQLKCEAHIYMPKGSSEQRQQAIRQYGATVTVINGNYDDAVRKAALEAKANHWFLIQDTAWQGYETVPLHIMQGYTTLLTECMAQLKDEIPTHVFVQAGVGSLAAALLGFLCAQYGVDRPIFIVVEPHKANCFYQSISNNKITIITGDLDTISAGLSCGEPNPQAWQLLQQYADAFVSCDDEITKQGMRILAQGKNGDPSIVSGESGAISMGIINTLLSDSQYKNSAQALKLDSQSKVLFISTEGDTDTQSYRAIIAS